MRISDRWKGLGLCLGILGVILAFIASLTVGVADLSPGDVIRGLISPAAVGNKEHRPPYLSNAATREQSGVNLLLLLFLPLPD